MASRQFTRLLRQSVPILRTRTSLLRFCHKKQLTQFPVHKQHLAAFHSGTIRFQEVSNIINIQSEEDFKERVLDSTTPVIVDFHATWCGPCKLLAPRLEAVVGAQGDKVLLAKVDIDEMPDIAMEHGVEAVPTVLAIKGGRVTDKFIGLKEDDELYNFVNKLVG